MGSNKSKIILGVSSTVWAVVAWLYQLLRNTVISDWYLDKYMELVLTGGNGEAQQFKDDFDAFYNALFIVLLIIMAVVVVFVIKYNISNGIKLQSKDAVANGTDCIVIGLAICVLFGWNLIGIILVALGGILFCRQRTTV